MACWYTRVAYRIFMGEVGGRGHVITYTSTASRGIWGMSPRNVLYSTLYEIDSDTI